MHFRFGILASVLFLMLSADGQTLIRLSRHQNDRDEDELSGPVHTVKVKTEPIFTAQGEKPVSDGWTPSVITYDRAGNALEIITYNEKGEVDQKSVGEVDRAGHKIGEQHFDSEGKLIDIWAWRYDDDDNQIEFKNVGADGWISIWSEFNYDQSGKLVSLLDLNEVGIIVRVTTCLTIKTEGCCGNRGQQISKEKVDLTFIRIVIGERR